VISVTAWDVAGNSTKATLSVVYAVTVTVQSGGGFLTVDGTSYFTSSPTLAWTPGSPHTISVSPPQSFSSHILNVWTAWSDGGEQSHTVSPTTNTTYIPSFKTQANLTFSAGTGGTVSPASGWYDTGQPIVMTATPSNGYVFTGWTSSTPGSGGSYGRISNPVTLIPSYWFSETATFVIPPTAIVQTIPAGRTFTVDGTNYSSAQTFSWISPSTHNIAIASPQSDMTGNLYAWTGWSDGGATSHPVFFTTSTTYTASFKTLYFNRISGGLLSNGDMSLSFVGLAGTNYALDRSWSLVPPSWIPQVTNPAGSGGLLLFTNTPNSSSNNFWRIHSVP